MCILLLSCLSTLRRICCSRYCVWSEWHVAYTKPVLLIENSSCTVVKIRVEHKVTVHHKIRVKVRHRCYTGHIRRNKSSTDAAARSSNTNTSTDCLRRLALVQLTRQCAACAHSVTAARVSSMLRAQRLPLSWLLSVRQAVHNAALTAASTRHMKARLTATCHTAQQPSLALKTEHTGY
jgi:hypothetical protein